MTDERKLKLALVGCGGIAQAQGLATAQRWRTKGVDRHHPRLGRDRGRGGGACLVHAWRQPQQP